VRIDAVSNPLEEGGVVFFPMVIVIPFTLFWIVGMMNAVNFMDGLDGLAGGVTAIGGVVLVLLSLRLDLPDVATLALVLAAVAIGFLFLNSYRASIIMGDTGAHFLGFALAVIAILGPAKIATAILVLGVPILEVAWSMVRRLSRRGRIDERDVGHLHHRLWEAGLGQPVVALAYWLLAGALGLIALLVERIYKVYAFAGLAALMVLLLVVLARLPRRRRIRPHT
jgi:UDP-N-acetylmuramyl pentapeptide phosphotransferase/UDP-N-acetylglucosamine-1-phosphate transferase